MKFWQAIMITGLILNLLLTACTPTPSVTIEDAIKDEHGNLIDKSSALFKVRVRGNVSGAKRLYVYLVVDDGNAEYIQPGLGEIGDGEFTGNLYLGVEDDPDSLNKNYTIFAVVTDKKHDEYDHLNLGSVQARSDKIELHRTQ